MIRKSTREKKSQTLNLECLTLSKEATVTGETSANHLFGKWKWEMTTATMIFLVRKLDGWMDGWMDGWEVGLNLSGAATTVDGEKAEPIQQKASRTMTATLQS
jgi:hypothetical protein